MSIKILVVDDEDDKRHLITRALIQCDDVRIENIAVATDGMTARRELTRERFDLVILDMALPMRPDAVVVDPEGGLRILEDIVERPVPGLKLPTHIVGITAYEDVYERAAGRFGSWLLTLTRYDPSSSAWIAALQARVRHIAAALRSRSADERQYDYDLAVVTALTDPELNMLRALPWDWNQDSDPMDHTIYWTGQWESARGPRRVCAAASPRMGMAAAAVLASKMVERCRPKVLAMVGISAGVRGRVNVGDVIVADPCWDWGHGKWTIDGPTQVFSPAPHQISLDAHVREGLRQLCTDHLALASIRDEWIADKPQHCLSMHIGPLASGASVLADGLTAERIAQQHRQLLGLEMEGYGVLTAAQEAARPRPLGVVLKSVVDFADGQKDDRWRNYAAFTSAQVLKRWAESSL